MDFLFVVENEETVVCIEGGAEVEWGTFSSSVCPRNLPLQVVRFPFLFSGKYDNWIG